MLTAVAIKPLSVEAAEACCAPGKEFCLNNWSLLLQPWLPPPPDTGPHTPPASSAATAAHPAHATVCNDAGKQQQHLHGDQAASAVMHQQLQSQMNAGAHSKHEHSEHEDAEYDEDEDEYAEDIDDPGLPGLYEEDDFDSDDDGNGATSDFDVADYSGPGLRQDDHSVDAGGADKSYLAHRQEEIREMRGWQVLDR